MPFENALCAFDKLSSQPNSASSAACFRFRNGLGIFFALLISSYSNYAYCKPFSAPKIGLSLDCRWHGDRYHLAERSEIAYPVKRCGMEL